MNFKNTTVNTGILLDAVVAAGGMRAAATKWHVDIGRLSRLVKQGQVPRLDTLKRICDGAKLRPSQVIVTLNDDGRPLSPVPILRVAKSGE
jgi:DNA-binding phage protein